MPSSDDRRVAESTVNGHWISTVKLSVDHGFETMVFCRHGKPCPLGETEAHYRTRKQAETGHFKMVEKVKEQHGTSTTRT